MGNDDYLTTRNFLDDDFTIDKAGFDVAVRLEIDRGN